MKRETKYFLAAFAALALAACQANVDDYFLDEEENVSEEPVVQDELSIQGVVISDGGRTLNVGVNLMSDLDGVPIDNPDSVQIVATEMLSGASTYQKLSQPVLKEVVRLGAEELAARNVEMEVLVDLTLPQSVVDAQQQAARQIRTIFLPESMNISFMDENGIRETLPATDYVISNYFKSEYSGGRKYLYRSVLDRISGITSAAASDTVRILTVFSDGRVYNRNHPIDPRHFSLQDDLSSICSSAGDKFLFYYVNFPDSDSQNEAGIFMQGLCESSYGMYQDHFDASDICGSIFDYFGLDYVDFNFVFQNPPHRIYNGRKHILKIECIHNGETVAKGETQYTGGSFYRPIVANGHSQKAVILQGVVIAFILAILVYLVFQLLVPKIRQIVFEKKYVTTFKHERMVVGNIMVGSECYYCKAPFVEGDRIVAKCKHVMHKSCWDENGYHCPEYSRNCKDGSHYYNTHNLLDPGNALFHMKWVLGAVFAGLFSWIIFSVSSNDFSIAIIQKIMFAINNITPGSKEAAEFYSNNITELNQLPSFGLYIGFALTCALSFMTVHRKGWWRTTLDVLARGVVGGICGYICFLAGAVISILLDLDESYIIDWVPWAVTGYLIVVFSTVGTRIKMRKKLIYGALAIGVISMILWDLVFVGRGTDYRVLLLLSHICFTVGIALSVAQASPRSERFYFHVGGAMKEMDIAIYKWFEANTNRVVTVGRSVDCDLVMSWDMAGDIAPVQARITKKGGHVHITPLEDGVVVKGRNLAPNKTKCLYHGTKFVIGKTEFIYQEKDI